MLQPKKDDQLKAKKRRDKLALLHIGYGVGRQRVTNKILTREEGSTYFYDEFREQITLNKGDDFVELRTHIAPFVETRRLVEHYKDVLVDQVLQYLTADSDAADAACKLMHALARDLQQDFLPYLVRFLHVSLQSLWVASGFRVVTEVDRIRTVLVLQTMTFKTLLPHLLAAPDMIRKVILQYERALSCTTEYMRRLSAETLAVLLRSLKAPEHIQAAVDALRAMLAKVGRKAGGRPRLQNGLAYLVASAVKAPAGLATHFSQFFGATLQCTLAALESNQLGEELLDAVQQCFLLLCNHCRDTKSTFQPMWDLLLDMVEQRMADVPADAQPESSAAASGAAGLVPLMRLFTGAVYFRGHGLLSDAKPLERMRPLATRMLRASDEAVQWEGLLFTIMALKTGLLSGACSVQLVDDVVAAGLPVPLVARFWHTAAIRNPSAMDAIVLPRLCRWVEDTVSQDVSILIPLLYSVLYLTGLGKVSRVVLPWSREDSMSPQVDPQHGCRLITAESPGSRTEQGLLALLDRTAAALAPAPRTKTRGAPAPTPTADAVDADQLWAALKVLQALAVADLALARGRLQALLEALQAAGAAHPGDVVLSLLAAECFTTLSLLTAHYSETADLSQLLPAALGLLQGGPGACGAECVTAVSDYFSLLLTNATETTATVAVTPDQLDRLLALLEPQLRSSRAAARAAALNVLSKVTAEGPDGAAAIDCQPFRLCLEGEAGDVLDLGQHRLKTAAVEAVRTLVANNALHPACFRAVCCYCIGGLFAKFTPLWAPLRATLVALANRDFSAFWAVFFAALRDFTLHQQAADTRQGGSAWWHSSHPALRLSSGQSVSEDVNEDAVDEEEAVSAVASKKRKKKRGEAEDGEAWSPDAAAEGKEDAVEEDGEEAAPAGGSRGKKRQRPAAANAPPRKRRKLGFIYETEKRDPLAEESREWAFGWQVFDSEDVTGDFWREAAAAASNTDRSSRADDRTYLRSLWAVLQELPELVRDHLGDVVQLFEEFVSLECEEYADGLAVVQGALQVREGLVAQRDAAGRLSFVRPAYHARFYAPKLKAFLALFSKVENLQGLPYHDRLKRLFFRFLQDEDPEMQTMALDGLYNCGDVLAAQECYKELGNLIQPQAARWQMRQFPLDQVLTNRREVLLLVVLILRPKFMEAARQNKARIHSKSPLAPPDLSTLFAYFCWLPARDVETLWLAVMRPLSVMPCTLDAIVEWKRAHLELSAAHVHHKKRRWRAANPPPSSSDPANPFDFFDVVNAMSVKQKTRGLLRGQLYLNMLEMAITHLNNLLEPYLDELLAMLSFLFTLVYHDTELYDYVKSQKLLHRTLRRVGRSLVQRLSTLWRRNPLFHDLPVAFLRVFPRLLAPLLRRLALPHDVVPPTLMLLETWATAEPPVRQFFVVYPELLRSLLPMLAQETLDPNVGSIVVDVMTALTDGMGQRIQWNPTFKEYLSEQKGLIASKKPALAKGRKKAALPATFGEAVIKPNIQLIYSTFYTAINGGLRYVRRVWAKAVNVLCRCSTFLTAKTDKTLLFKIVALFLRFLNTSELLDDGQVSNALKIVQYALPLAGLDFYRRLEPLLWKLQGWGTRAQLMEVAGISLNLLDAHRDEKQGNVPPAEVTARQAHVAELVALAKRTAQQTSGSDGGTVYDFQTALNSLADLVTFIRRVVSQSVPPRPIHFGFAMGNVLHLMAHDELSVRRTASQTAEQLLLATAKLPDRREYTQELLDQVVYPAIKRQMATDNRRQEVRMEFLRLMAVVAKEYAADFPAFAPLVGRTVEDGFFANVLHVQAHRRLGALQLFRRAMAERPLPEGAINLIFVPLFIAILQEQRRALQGSKGGRKGGANDDDDEDVVPYFLREEEQVPEVTGDHRDLLDTLLLALADCSAHLKFGRYRMLLKDMLRLAQTHPTIERLAIQAVCEILNRFHFEVGQEKYRPQHWKEDVKRWTGAVAGPETGGEGSDDDDEDVAEGEGTDGAAPKNRPSDEERKALLPARVHNLLVGRVLPSLQKFLVDKKSGNAVRPYVATALVKTLLLAPMDVLRMELPPVIAALANALKLKKDDSHRDSTRRVLVEVARMLGPRWLPYIIRVLRDTLVSGFQVHVLGFTCTELLRSMEAHFQEKVVPAEVMPPKKLPTVAPWEASPEERAAAEAEAKADGRQRGRRAAAAEGVGQPAGSTDSALDKANEAAEVKESRTLIDECFPLLLDIFVEDFVGMVAEEKASEMTAKAKEVKGSRALEGMELLCRYGTFDFVAPQVVARLRQLLRPPAAANAADPTLAHQLAVPLKLLRKVQLLIPHVARAFVANTSASRQALFVFVYRTLERNQQLREQRIADFERHQQERELEAVDDPERLMSQADRMKHTFEVQPAPIRRGFTYVEPLPAPTTQRKRTVRGRTRVLPTGEGEAEDTSQAVLDHMDVLCLLLMDYILRQSPKALAKSKPILQMLDPFMRLLLGVLQGEGSDEVVLRCLKAFAITLRLPLPSASEVMGEVVETCFDILERGNDVRQACYRLIAKIVASGRYTLEEGQTEILLHLIHADVLARSNLLPALACVKVIVQEKVKLPEVYDLIQPLSELVVWGATKKAVSQRAAAAVVRFLLYYPMTTSKLQSHLDWVLKNLKYPYEKGRLALLGILQSVVTKFPAKVVRNEFDLFFLPLVSTMSSDESVKCRKKAADVVARLLAVEETLPKALKFIAAWARADVDIRAAAANLLLSILTSHPGRAADLKDQFLPWLVENVESAFLPASEQQDGDKADVNGLEGLDGDVSDEDMLSARNSVADSQLSEGSRRKRQKRRAAREQQARTWRLLYFSLSCVEKLLQALPALCDDPTFQPLWPRVTHHLLHYHLWVRAVCTRLVAVLLTAAEAAAPGASSATVAVAVPAPRTALAVAARWSPAALDAPAVLAVGLRLVRQLLQLDRTHDLGDDWKDATSTVHARETDSATARHTIKALVLAVGALLRLPAPTAPSPLTALFQAVLANVQPLLKMSRKFHTAAAWDRMTALMARRLHMGCATIRLIGSVAACYGGTHEELDRCLTDAVEFLMILRFSRQVSRSVNKLAREVLDVLNTKLAARQAYQLRFGELSRQFAGTSESQQRVVNERHAARHQSKGVNILGEPMPRRPAATAPTEDKKKKPATAADKQKKKGVKKKDLVAVGRKRGLPVGMRKRATGSAHSIRKSAKAKWG